MEKPEYTIIKMMRRRRRKLLIIFILVSFYLFYKYFLLRERGVDQSLLSGPLVKCVNNEMLNISSPRIITREIFSDFQTCKNYLLKLCMLFLDHILNLFVLLFSSVQCVL